MSIRDSGRSPGAVLRTVLVAASLSFSAAAVAAPPQQLIVKYRDSAGIAAAGANRSARASAVLDAVSNRLAVRFERKRVLATGADLIRVSRGGGGVGALARGGDDFMTESELEAIALELEQNPDVLYAEVDRLLKPLATPNDPRYNEQWHYYETTGGLRLPAAWDQSIGTGAVVAVLDTGYRPHTDLNANIIGGYDFISDTFVANDGGGRDSNAQDPGDWMDAGECGGGYPPQDQGSSWHGTHVAGTIAAVTNNGVGVAGVAYGADVVPVRVLGKCGGLTSDIADAIIWASGGSVSGVPSNSNPADVINMSLGGGGSCGSTTQAAINTARANGTVVVVAAGNDNANAGNSNPANCNGVVTVAATNRNGGRSYYSNFGSVVDVAAPGGELFQGDFTNGILSTLNSGSTSPGSDTYEMYQGTSMATPHVAGVAALMMSADSTLSPDDVETMLKNTARAFPASCSQCGSGIVDADAAVDAALGGGGPGPGDDVLENGVAKTGLSGSQGSELRFTLEVPAGATNLSFQISGGTGDADMYVQFGSAPTTGDWDCRPYLNGNNETCNISNVQTGTYHVMLRGYTAYSGVSLVGSYDEGGGGGGNFFETTTNVNIPDPGMAESPLSVSRSGTSGTISVHVEIIHTYRGDLRIELIAPNGTLWTLRQPSGGSANNIIQDFNVSAGSTPSNGTWRLRVTDIYNWDDGYIDEWSITFP